MKYYLILLLFLFTTNVFAQQDTTKVYKKRVLETTEIDFLMSYYSQDGDNASVSGGIGTEELTDITPTIVVSYPLNDDDVLTIDVGISAYSSASTSNIDPFDGAGEADPFQASSGASASDSWVGGTFSYSHSSDDRNGIWSGKVSVSSEYDYFSIGAGGSYTRLFNEKNTEIGVHANVYLDTWKLLYPIELRPFQEEGLGLNDPWFSDYTIEGNTDYTPKFTEFDSKTRNTYLVGFTFSQILSKNLQGSLSLDFVSQEGLLSTPFHRINFGDIDDSFIENFQLADDVEKLPDTRFKVAIGGRLNYFVNEIISIRTYYRFYNDDWGIDSHTASIEIPIKITDKFTLYPSYRYYTQTAADYFAAHEENISTQTFYTSDYDLSEFDANQYGFGVSYTDIFTKARVWKYGIKNIDLRFHTYDRSTGLNAWIISGGIKFVMQ